MDQVIIPPASATTNGFIASHGDHNRQYQTGWNSNDTSHFYTSQQSVVEALTVRGVASELATEKIGAASILATSVASGTLGVAIEKTAAAGLLEQVKNAAANQLVVEKVAAASALLAAQNHAATLAQAAACCCELKEKIGEEGQKTRDLINQNERERLQTRIAALERLLPQAV